MNDLASANRDRLVNALRVTPNDTAARLPWLPVECAAMITRRIALASGSEALTAYAGIFIMMNTRTRRVYQVSS